MHQLLVLLLQGLDLVVHHLNLHHLVHLLAVALEHGHHLLGALVKHGGVLVGAARHDLVGISHADVQSQNPGHGGRVQPGVAGLDAELLDAVSRGQALGHGLASLLPLLGEDGGFLLQLLHDLLGDPGDFLTVPGPGLLLAPLAGHLRDAHHGGRLGLQGGQSLPGRGHLLVKPGDDRRH